MLKISSNTIGDKVDLNQYKSFQRLKTVTEKNLRIVAVLLIVTVLCLFLPWTQNIRSKGYVTTRSPQQRPQSIQSVIAGRIHKWYVQEGDYVNAGDTIVYITEVKSEYFDPELLARTAEQIDAKNQSINSYDQKIGALQNQYDALVETSELKRKQINNKIIQAENKIKMDSIDLITYGQNLDIAKNQLERTQELYDKGLKSLTELQEKQNKVQTSTAKYQVQENKLYNQKNELTNLHIELVAVEKEYTDKISKSLSDQQSARADMMESIAATSKLQNQYSNYDQRQQLYYITAPQSGYITKTMKKGIGETLKEGSDVVTIVPAEYDLAVEVYLKPQDIPLIKTGKEARLRFDGWPAIVISGWPESSTGVFTGEVVAIDRYISDNGLYRVLISPSEETKAWPENLSMGTGVNAFVLLNKVPMWYEMWRQLNGFPADFYDADEKAKEVKRKAPLKSVK